MKVLKLLKTLESFFPPISNVSLFSNLIFIIKASFPLRLEQLGLNLVLQIIAIRVFGSISCSLCHTIVAFVPLTCCQTIQGSPISRQALTLLFCCLVASLSKPPVHPYPPTSVSVLPASPANLLQPLPASAALVQPPCSPAALLQPLFSHPAVPSPVVCLQQPQTSRLNPFPCNSVASFCSSSLAAPSLGIQQPLALLAQLPPLIFPTPLVP